MINNRYHDGEQEVDQRKNVEIRLEFAEDCVTLTCSDDDDGVTWNICTLSSDGILTLHSCLGEVKYLQTEGADAFIKTEKDA